MERRDHKTMPKQISVKEKLRPKMAHGAKLLKPLQTDLAARKQTGPHNDNHAPTLYFQARGSKDKKRERSGHTWLEALLLPVRVKEG